MTAKRVMKYLDLAYRRRVLGEHIKPEQLIEADEEFAAAVRARLARINSLGLGANLANRDFASYHHKAALERALAIIEQRQKHATQQQG
jgi:anti-sigma factor ChrR (cupin superfamily)